MQKIREWKKKLYFDKEFQSKITTKRFALKPTKLGQ